jgi:hypothetical protein
MTPDTPRPAPTTFQRVMYGRYASTAMAVLNITMILVSIFLVGGWASAILLWA